MSNIAANKKYLNLDEVRISYRAKDDSIHITSLDDDLTGSAFHLTLNKNSESEQILRELLIEKGLIRLESSSPLPSTVPLNLNSQSSSDEFVLGLAEDGSAIWDTSLHANVFITGNSRALPVLTRNLFAHCLTHNSDWQFYGIDLNAVESSQYRKFTKTVTSIANTLDEGIKMIDELITEMNNRYSLMSSQGIDTYSKLENPGRKILFVIDEATLFMNNLLCTPRETRQQVLAQFTSLLRLGHSAGIHVVLSTLRMDVVFFPEAMRSHFEIRIAAERLDAVPSVLLFGSGAATCLPKNTRGRGLISIKGVEKVFQTPSSTPQTLIDWVVADEGKAEPVFYEVLKTT